MEKKNFYGTGRRKSSVARVYIKKGTGKVSVNSLKVNEYFKRDSYIKAINLPVIATQLKDKLDVICFVNGGGTTGQADAIKLGLARAILSMDSELRKSLKVQKLLTRDPREVERKKYGQKGARGRFQYSKR